MSPVIATIKFLTISFTMSKKGLKSSKPCHRSNSRINSTKIQQHQHDLTKTSSDPAFNTTMSGNILELTLDNYDEWKDNMILIL